MRLTRMAPALVVALVAAFALAACGGSDSPEVADLGTETAATGEATTTEAPEDAEEAILAYTECMRDEGIDLPDPDFSGGGPGGGGLLELDLNDRDVQAAQEKCQSNLEGIQAQFDPEDQEAFQDAALEYAQCMRDKGFDVPDPDFSQGPGQGGFGLFGGGELDPNDPGVQAAMDECQDAFADLGFGPGGQQDGAP